MVREEGHGGLASDSQKLAQWMDEAPSPHPNPAPIPLPSMERAKGKPESPTHRLERGVRGQIAKLPPNDGALLS